MAILKQIAPCLHSLPALTQAACIEVACQAFDSSRVSHSVDCTRRMIDVHILCAFAQTDVRLAAEDAIIALQETFPAATKDALEAAARNVRSLVIQNQLAELAAKCDTSSEATPS